MTIKRTFAAELKRLPDMVEFVKKEARRVGFEGKGLFKVELAMEECLVNVIRYAYPDSSGELQIYLSTLPNQGLEVEILDQGKPFDPVAYHAKADENAPIEERSPGGWGVVILRKTCDEIIYEHDGTYNRLKLRIFVHPQQP
ncbi:MAG: ATP-binding protein [Chlamydiia bacterium]|nr:ATP-binding protein [Chlamydiia bacterium]